HRQVQLLLAPRPGPLLLGREARLRGAERRQRLEPGRGRRGVAGLRERLLVLPPRELLRHLPAGRADVEGEHATRRQRALLQAPAAVPPAGDGERRLRLVYQERAAAGGAGRGDGVTELTAIHSPFFYRGATGAIYGECSTAGSHPPPSTARR